MSSVIPERQYALVAYIRDAVGEFVENLRGEIHPAHAHLPAHITVLPPRLLQGSETEAISLVESVCETASPFEVSLGDVENFMPKTPTVFIRVAFAAYRLRELHDRLNIGVLAYDEQWPYMPHLTIAKVDTLEYAATALDIARQRWARFSQPRKVVVEELTFVRQGDDSNTWVDLAPIPLGKNLVSAR
jgi:2'-5' RNA ligase